MNEIVTLPVYSKLSPIANIPNAVNQRRPQQMHLSEHQVAMYETIRSGEYDVIINTAMTGDGKSLAAYLPALVHDEPILAMYPTNELGRDQLESLPDLKRVWQCQLSGPEQVTAQTLDRLVYEDKVRFRREGIDLLTDNYEIILTNPDIFHYLAQFFYTAWGESPDIRFMRRVINNFEYFVFDEFHIFQAPQIVSVVNALLLIREFSRQSKRFLFLSATPDDLLVDYLQRADFRVKVVTTEGRYLHTRDIPDKAAWRPIVHECRIAFDALTPQVRVEEWVETHIDDILQFFREQPVAKGAIIVNSVASAYRLKDRLAPEFKKFDLHVELNTGLSSDELKRVSRTCDLLIGTSTVDVGVDFRINFLVFESRDAGTFLQRLGRLGRHERDDNGQRFVAFQAYALVPRFIEERLFTGYRDQSPALSNGALMNREALTAAIQKAYPPPARFPSYAREWGWIQSAHIWRSLQKPPIRDSYRNQVANLARRSGKAFRYSPKQVVHDYRELLKDSEQRLLVQEAQSFRGDSPWQCALTDMTDEGKIKRYSLFTLLRNGQLEWLGRQAFQVLASESWGDQPQFDTDKLLGWFRFCGFGQEQRALKVDLNHHVRKWDATRLGKPQVLDKIELNCDVNFINSLNRHVRKRKFVVTVCRIHPAELRPYLYLPPMFRLFDFTDLDGQIGTIAFAREALLLHVALKQRGVDCGGDLIF